MERPDTQYAKVGDLSVAYQVTGDGPMTIVNVPQWTTHLEADWEVPEFAAEIEYRSRYARCIRLDQLGAGMSDPLPAAGVPPIEAWIDSLLAVMDREDVDAAGLTGHSWGGTLAMAFAALHPERVRALVIHGATARTMAAPDYPIGLPAGARQSSADLWQRIWGTGTQMAISDPEGEVDEPLRRRLGRYEQMSASPSTIRRLLDTVFFDMDVRDLLGHVRAPTLVLHSADDRMIPATHGRYIADQIPGAIFEEVAGSDHYMWRGERLAHRLRRTREFFTGTDAAPAASDRILATLLFTDIVDSTGRAATLGDQEWRRLLDRHDAVMRKMIDDHRGRAVKQTGDGFLARFDAPAHAIRCAQAARDALDGLGIGIRAAVHTGEVELRGDDIGGLGVHVASRILGESDAGTVTTSSTVRDLTIGSGIAFSELGRRELRGVPGEWTLLVVRET